MTTLFRKLTLDQLDDDYRAWVARQFADIPSEWHMTIVRYLPTGQIDFIFHEQQRPPAHIMRELAVRHLYDARTGTMQ